MKKISVLTLLFVAACQPSTSTSSSSSAAVTSPANIQSNKISVFNVPASDDAETLDFTKLPEGFPIIAEVNLPAAPQGCRLSKANRFDLAGGKNVNYDSRYVFTSSEDADTYQLGITGALRTVKQSGSADLEGKKVRYFKTVDGPEVEILVETSLGEDGRQKGIVGRIKAWDAGVPLMCGYNRVEVVGDCDL